MRFRLLDFLAAGIGLFILAPLLAPAIIAIWFQDFRSPFYVAERVGQNGKKFRMVKLRTMTVGADRSGVTSTSDSDTRITGIGRVIRRLKLDEVPQLWNVLLGSMSLVGPRPNVVKWGVELYTQEELRLLSIPPGVTDFSSVVFADEGSILKGSFAPDLKYNQLIRPWKSRLSLVYVDNRSIRLYVTIIVITAVSVISRKIALALIQRELRRLGITGELLVVAARSEPLRAYPPPGSAEIAHLEVSKCIESGRGDRRITSEATE